MKIPFIFLLYSTAIVNFAVASTLVYDEDVLGDLSDDYLAPTPLIVSEGSNFLTGGLSGGTNDLDLFELIVPQGLEVTAIRILDFEGGQAGSFFLLQTGSTLSAPPSNNFSDFIGFSILSPGGIGSDILPTVILPAVTALPPFFGASTLAAGSYAGWLNETGPASTYSLQFEVSSTVPEPSSQLLAGLAALSLCCLRRK